MDLNCMDPATMQIFSIIKYYNTTMVYGYTCTIVMYGQLNLWIQLWIKLWIQQANHKITYGFSTAGIVGAPNLQVVQGSTVYTKVYYSAIMNEILPFATTWMDLKSILLGEVSQTEDKYFVLSLICIT